MQDELPKVLVVEDEECWQTIYKSAFKRAAQVIIAATHDDAKILFNGHRHDLALIVMDGNLSGGSNTNTLGLVRMFRAAEFAGPIVAASSNKDSNLQLMNTGCSHNFGKEFAPDRVLRLLDDMKPKPPEPREAVPQVSNNNL